MSEVEETIKRIQSHKGVIGIIVVSQDGETLLNLKTGLFNQSFLAETRFVDCSELRKPCSEYTYLKWLNLFFIKHALLSNPFIFRMNSYRSKNDLLTKLLMYFKYQT